MKKIIKLTESELVKIIKNIINEGFSDIDNILDKIGEVGYDGLSNKEKEYIDYYSKTGKFLPDEKPEVSFNQSDSEDAISYRIDDVKFSFSHEDSWEDEDGLHHSGYLSVSGNEFYGKIDCDEDGDYISCSFEDPEQNELFQMFPELEETINTFIDSICEELKGDTSY